MHIIINNEIVVTVLRHDLKMLGNEHLAQFLLLEFLLWSKCIMMQSKIKVISFLIIVFVSIAKSLGISLLCVQMERCLPWLKRKISFLKSKKLFMMKLENLLIVKIFHV